ncbi:hypothetical protein JCM11641_001516 [Rhodosporidiobolus odoratus]
MPNTMAPVDVEGLIHPVKPAGHGEAKYSAGDDLPAAIPDDSPAVSPSTTGRPALLAQESSTSTTSRSRSPFRNDPFFQRGGTQEDTEKANAMRQVAAAQEASYAADLERAIRRSKRDMDKNGPSTERGTSQGRSMSRIRSAIKDIVNDPFWHRPTKEEADSQDEYMKRVIMEEINAARASTEAGDLDRAKARSRSRVRSPLASQPGSRSTSRVRSVVGGILGGNGGNSDRGVAGFGHATKEEPLQE